MPAGIVTTATPLNKIVLVTLPATLITTATPVNNIVLSYVVL